MEVSWMVSAKFFRSKWIVPETSYRNGRLGLRGIIVTAVENEEACCGTTTVASERKSDGWSRSRQEVAVVEPNRMLCRVTKRKAVDASAMLCSVAHTRVCSDFVLTVLCCVHSILSSERYDVRVTEQQPKDVKHRVTGSLLHLKYHAKQLQ